MSLEVGPDGLLIPRAYLEGVEMVVLRREGERFVVEPVGREAERPSEGRGDRPSEPSPDDPIRHLGRNPVLVGVDDGSLHHDRHILEDVHGECR